MKFFSFLSVIFLLGTQVTASEVATPEIKTTACGRDGRYLSICLATSATGQRYILKLGQVGKVYYPVVSHRRVKKPGELATTNVYTGKLIRFEDHDSAQPVEETATLEVLTADATLNAQARLSIEGAGVPTREWTMTRWTRVSSPE